MDWKSIFAPMFAKGLSWATRQAEGSERGTRDVARYAPAIVGISTAAAGLAAPAVQKAMDQISVSKANNIIARIVGVPSTEDGLISLVGTLVTLHPTLDLNQQGALTSYLESRIVGSLHL